MVFALDATMSRQPTWDMACALQADMFREAAALGSLDIRLVYYRGLDECRASGWISDSAQLAKLMSKIDCRGGNTQIGKVLSESRREAVASGVRAVVFVGDAMEEPIDALCVKARKMAAAPYTPPKLELADYWKNLTYDGHRDIRFKMESGLWAETKGDFSIDFFHPGWTAKKMVTLHEVSDGKEEVMKFDQKLFDYGKQKKYVYSPPTKPFLGIGHVFNTQNMDARVEKSFGFASGQSISVMVDLFNAFNTSNWGCYDAQINPTSGSPNANYNRPGCAALGRRVQIGMRYGLLSARKSGM